VKQTFRRPAQALQRDRGPREFEAVHRLENEL
jgi:hypothetical protein